MNFLDGYYCWGDLSYDYSNFSTSGVSSADIATIWESDYAESTTIMFVIQTVTVDVGIIGLVCRWFTAIKFKCSKESTKGFKIKLKPESYWIKRLEEWKKSSIVLQIRAANCWALPLVTLTCIAIAISKINKDIADRLVRSMSEGLSYVRHFDETMDTKRNLTNSRDAVDKVWLGVELDGKWLDEDLTRIAPKETFCQETFQILANFAQKIVIKYKADINGSLDGNPTNWPINVIAANSMYRICKSLLLDDEGNNHQINHDELFVKLFDMIACILLLFLFLANNEFGKVYLISLHHKWENLLH
ncbi:hypothetical protein ACSBR2_030665 [Camellia fascicularis]